MTNDSNAPSSPHVGPQSGDGSPDLTRRPPRRFRIWWFVALGLALLIFAGPSLVAWSPLRHELPRTRIRGFRGSIRVGSATLSWFGPTVLRDVEFFDEAGELLLRTAVTEDRRSLLTRLFDPESRPLLRVRGSLLTVRLRPGGSNLEDARRPVLEYEGTRPPEAQEFALTEGGLQLVDVQTGNVTEWTDISLSVRNPSGPDGKHELTVRATPTALAGKGQVEISANWNEPPPQRRADVSVRVLGEGVPLSTLQPAFVRLLPAELSHSMNFRGAGGCDLQIVISAAADHSLDVTLNGEAAAADFELACSDRLGSDVVRLRNPELKFEASITPAHWNLKQFELASELGRWTAQGRISRAGDPLNVQEPLRLQGSLDLDLLAAMLPKSLAFPPGTKLTSGELELELQATPGAVRGESDWSLDVRTPHVVGEIDGTLVDWTDCVTVGVALRRDAEGFELKTLRIVTPVISLAGEPADDGMQLAGQGDLGELLRRSGLDSADGALDVDGTWALRGRLTRPAGWQMRLQGEIVAKDISVRRLLTRMEARPVVGVAPPPMVDEPAAPPERAGDRVPIPARPDVFDRRGQRARAKAERVAKRNARRKAPKADQSARIAARKDPIEVVPVDEWVEVWRDSELTLAGEYLLDLDERLLTIESTSLRTQGLEVGAAGRVEGLLSRNEIQLLGRIAATLQDLADHWTPRDRAPLRFDGTPQFTFSVSGRPGALRSELTGGWQQASALGLVAGPAELTLVYHDRIATLEPVAVVLGGGVLHLEGGLDLRGPSLVATHPGGLVIEDVELTQEVCAGWLQYITPILSQATRAEGRFSLRLDETSFSIGDTQDRHLSGRLDIPSGRVLPGPLFDLLKELIALVETAVGRDGQAGELLGLEQPLATMDNQSIIFQLRDGRLFHSPALVRLRGVGIMTIGSVGLDQTLDLTAILLFPEALTSRLPFLAGPDGRGLAVPIRGTLRNPRLEPGAIKRLLVELGGGALEDLLGGTLLRLIGP